MVEHILDESFVMVSTRPRSLARVAADDYIRIRESPQFQHRHTELLPALEHTALSVETASMVLTCLQSMDACAYLPRRLAAPRIADGRLHGLSGAPVLGQSVHVAYHGRNRGREAVRTAIEELRAVDIDQ